jgi:hypothetical protein
VPHDSGQCVTPIPDQRPPPRNESLPRQTSLLQRFLSIARSLAYDPREKALQAQEDTERRRPCSVGVMLPSSVHAAVHIVIHRVDAQYTTVVLFAAFHQHIYEAGIISRGLIGRLTANIRPVWARHQDHCTRILSPLYVSRSLVSPRVYQGPTSHTRQLFVQEQANVDKNNLSLGTYRETFRRSSSTLLLTTRCPYRPSTTSSLPCCSSFREMFLPWPTCTS